jgi:alpha-aminoadipic semialdehyde synthase
VLGAGLVAGPAVELLSRCASRKVVVVSAVEGEAAALAATIGRPNIEARTMDCGGAADAASLVVEAIADASAALSLLPASMHGAVAAAGIAHGTPVVTACYISEELAAMGPAAEAAGVPVLGEMGLDPGMDHMSAMQLIDEAKAAGGRVVSFRSVCGVRWAGRVDPRAGLAATRFHLPGALRYQN